MFDYGLDVRITLQPTNPNWKQYQDNGLSLQSKNGKCEKALGTILLEEEAWVLLLEKHYEAGTHTIYNTIPHDEQNKTGDKAEANNTYLTTSCQILHVYTVCRHNLPI